MPTLDNIIQQKKKSKQKPTDETKPDETAKKTDKQTVKQPKEQAVKEKKSEPKLNTIEMVETKLLNEEKKKKKYEKSAQVTRNFPPNKKNYLKLTLNYKNSTL